MRIVILTQDDPFYLAENLDFLLKNLPKETEVVATVLFDVSPFGKRESFLDKARKSLDIFGWSFFLYYSWKFVLSKFNKKKQLKLVLENHKVPILQLEGSINSKENRAILEEYRPDLFISIGGNQIFKTKLINLPTFGTLNLHTALLPKYRGLMPSFWVLKNNEKFTGVSVFFVDEGIDSGPILVQKKVEIGNRSQEELIKHTKHIGMQCILEAVEKILHGKYELIANNAAEMTYFSFPKKEDVKEFYRAGKKFF